MNTPIEEIIQSHEILILELRKRLDSLENIVNRIMQGKPPYWDTANK